jgi:hypothetical protein
MNNSEFSLKRKDKRRLQNSIRYAIKELRFSAFMTILTFIYSIFHVYESPDSGFTKALVCVIILLAFAFHSVLFILNKRRFAKNCIYSKNTKRSLYKNPKLIDKFADKSAFKFLFGLLGSVVLSIYVSVGGNHLLTKDAIYVLVSLFITPIVLILFNKKGLVNKIFKGLQFVFDFSDVRKEKRFMKKVKAAINSILIIIMILFVAVYYVYAFVNSTVFQALIVSM